MSPYLVNYMAILSLPLVIKDFCVLKINNLYYYYLINCSLYFNFSFCILVFSNEKKKDEIY